MSSHVITNRRSSLVAHRVESHPLEVLESTVFPSGRIAEQNLGVACRVPQAVHKACHSMQRENITYNNEKRTYTRVDRYTMPMPMPMPTLLRSLIFSLLPSAFLLGAALFARFVVHIHKDILRCLRTNYMVNRTRVFHNGPHAWVGVEGPLYAALGCCIMSREESTGRYCTQV